MDWPIDYEDIEPFYEQAEAELGVSANVDDQRFPGIDTCSRTTTSTRCRESRHRCLINSLARQACALGRQRYSIPRNGPVRDIASRPEPAGGT